MSRWVRRIKSDELMDVGPPADGQPWVCDWRSFDISATVAAGIRNAGPGCVAVSLSMLGGKQMIEAAENAAAERGIRILWWIGPNIAEIPEDGKSRLRGFVIEARRKAWVG